MKHLIQKQHSMIQSQQSTKHIIQKQHKMNLMHKITSIYPIIMSPIISKLEKSNYLTRYQLVELLIPISKMLLCLEHRSILNWIEKNYFFTKLNLNQIDQLTTHFCIVY